MLENKDGNIIGHEQMKGRLYLLDAKVIQNSQEASHHASSPKNETNYTNDIDMSPSLP